MPRNTVTITLDSLTSRIGHYDTHTILRRVGALLDSGETPESVMVRLNPGSGEPTGCGKLCTCKRASRSV